MPKQDKPDYVRLVSPEKIGYLAWQDDPLYRLKSIIEEMGFAPQECMLPLTVLLGQQIDIASLINSHVQERKQFIRQLQEYGDKLGVEELLSLVGKLRALVVQDFLLERLHAIGEGADQGATKEDPESDRRLRSAPVVGRATGGPGSDGAHPTGVDSPKPHPS